MIRVIIVLCLGTFTTPITFNEPNHLRIAGGRPVPNQSYTPFFAQVVYMNRYHCGGTIISERAILTAASCLMYRPLVFYRVYIGDNRIQQGVEYRILDVIQHPGFRYEMYEHNIGVILTVKNILFKKSSVETLPLYSGSNPLERLKHVVVMGFGYLEKETDYTDLIKTVLPQVIPNEQCANAYNTSTGPKPMVAINENVFCTGENTGPCEGDEGGPAVYEDQLIGIISWGMGCGQPQYPRTYVYVPNYKEWILDNMVSANMPPYEDNIGNIGKIQYTMVYLAEGDEIVCVAAIITVRDFLTSTACSSEIQETTWFIHHGSQHAQHPLIKVYRGFSIYPDKTNKLYDIIFLKTDPIKLLELYQPVTYVSSYENITGLREDAWLLTHVYIQTIAEPYVEVYKRMIKIIYKDRCQLKYGEVIPFTMGYLHFCITLEDEYEYFGSMNASPVFSALYDLMGMIVWQGKFKEEAFAVALYTPRFFAYWEKFLFNKTPECRNAQC